MQPNSEPDYFFWKEKDVWFLPDAAKLICGRDPVNRYPGRPRYNTKHKVIDIIDMSFDAVRQGGLKPCRDALIPNHVQILPSVFICWAVERGLEVPEPLQELLDRDQEEFSLRDMVKERVVTVARTLWTLEPELSLQQVTYHKAMKTIIGDEFIPPHHIEALIQSHKP